MGYQSNQLLYFVVNSSDTTSGSLVASRRSHSQFDFLLATKYSTESTELQREAKRQKTSETLL